MVTSSAPLFVSSGDLIADRRYRWAIDHARRGDLAIAADIVVQTVELAPAFATAWFALGAIRDGLSDRAGADRLIASDLTRFLRAEAADQAQYHLVLAADVFVYCGELHSIAAATAAVLAGLFAFTVESHDGPDVVLGETLRYAHSADYLREALKRAGLNLLALDPASKSTEKGVPISGLVIVARSGG